ncbi:MAG: dinitrogenase iron-molybdenum cofactor biosynthesis protein [Clostridiales Family XIII bacterium]|jgi:predicted Fe-Mo cluster-binding NifX family protein|nr:dinitrogenase iron-molybdenum cofactor biosynthesis protein [Clostridiales Family XIII bacterium]
MKHRIAVSTTDGLTVYQHFGKSREFLIVDIDGDEYKSGERRIVAEPPCGAGGHNTALFDAVLELLGDCEAVVTAVIGQGAAEYLMVKGMRVFEGPGIVDNVLRTIASKRMLDSEAGAGQ